MNMGNSGRRAPDLLVRRQFVCVNNKDYDETRRFRLSQGCLANHDLRNQGHSRHGLSLELI